MALKAYGFAGCESQGVLKGRTFRCAVKLFMSLPSRASTREKSALSVSPLRGSVKFATLPSASALG